jgi:hypothetical protein
VGGGVGAPCVTWVLDERDVVSDNNRDLGWCATRVHAASGYVMEDGLMTVT